MMKYIFKILILLSIAAVSNAQTEMGLQFDHEHSWPELLKKAKEEQKLIYVDGYTTWCGPCKQMSSQIFPQKEVGDFYNANFIGFKAQIDTGKNDGDYVKARYADFKNVAETYQVKVFPTHLFINGDGEIVHRAVGSMSAETFIELGQTALNPDKQYGTLKKKYESGDRTPSLLANLVQASTEAYDKKLSDEALNAYLATQQDLFTEENVHLIYDAMNALEGKGFEAMKTNPEKFDQVLGEGSAAKKIRNLAIKDAYPALFTGKDKKPDFSGIQNTLKEKVGEAYAAEITDYLKITYYQNKKDWKNFETAVTAYVSKHQDNYLTGNDLNNFAWQIFENVSAKPALQNALKWALKSVDKEDKSYNNDTVANLYYKLNQKDKAVEYEQKAIDLAKKEGADTKDFEELLAKFKSGK